MSILQKPSSTLPELKNPQDTLENETCIPFCEMPFVIFLFPMMMPPRYHKGGQKKSDHGHYQNANPKP
jgi:hypothetical protein